jgi:hypothetical protein
MGLYTKTEAVQPEKSMLGCMVATALLVFTIGAVAVWGRAQFVLGDTEKADRLMAERAAARFLDGLEQAMQDAGVSSPAELFKTDEAFAPPRTVEEAERQTQLLRAVLFNGASAEAQLRDELRAHLKNEAYAARLSDPWGRGYYMVSATTEEGAPAVAVLSAGKNGTLDSVPHLFAKPNDDVVVVRPLRKP